MYLDQRANAVKIDQTLFDEFVKENYLSLSLNRKMSGNNSSYTHWKPNVSLDIIAAGGGASGYGNVKTSTSSQPISMATLTAIPSHGEYLVSHPSYGKYF